MRLLLLLKRLGMIKKKTDHCGTKTVYTPKGLKGDDGAPGAGGLLKKIEIDITSAEILAMHTTKKNLLPVDTLKGYDIISMVYIRVPNTVDYTYVGASPEASIRAVLTTPFGDEDIFALPAPAGTLALSASVNVIANKMVEFHDNPNVYSAFSNSSVDLRVEGQMTVGDHDAKVIILYRDIV